MNYKARIGPADTARAKHAPGPWLDDEFYGIITPQGALATYTNNDDGIHWIDEPTRLLVKSAPDLLAACETLRSAMVHMEEFDRLPDDTCPADLIDYLSAAIARAEGV